MKTVFAANWKLHKNPKETREFFSEWKKVFQSRAGAQVVFFPPATNLEATSQSLEGTEIKWGSQNCYADVKGAFTGETSAQVVKDLGGHYILLGHSERRSLFSETDEMIGRKFQLVQKLDLIPMLCIGETLPERQSGQTFQVLKNQLVKGLSLADKAKSLAIAYEPVWAIGTGQVATPEQVREAHAELRRMISEMGFSETTPLLYGGSVKPDNAKELLAVPHVNGFLVGGASLEVPGFLKICES